MNSSTEIVPPRMAEIGRRGQPVDLLAGGDVDPQTGRLLSIAQLQSVLRRQADVEKRPATRSLAGFSSMDGAAAVAVAEGSPWLLVVAAQPGVGCSTTALAIADAAAMERPAVHLIEVAHSGHSGLGAVTSQELGAVEGGWRRGRRGVVTVDRPSGTSAQADQCAPPPAVRPGNGLLTIVDAGGTWADSTADQQGPWWRSALAAPPIAVVAVCRPSIPGVDSAERLISTLCTENGANGYDEAKIRLRVASVGGSRWSGPVLAACGPQLGKLRVQHLVVGVPQVRRLKISGPTADPLPRSLITAGRKLWLLTAPASGTPTRLDINGGPQ